MVSLVSKSIGLVFLAQSFCVLTDGVYLKTLCRDDSHCVENSHCVVSSCDDRARICQCNSGWFPDNSFTKCLQVRQLGEACNSTTVCMEVSMKCSRGVCDCVNAFEPTDDGQSCRPSGIKGHEFSALGEPCSETRVCSSAGENVCLGGICRCRPGMRPRTHEELLLQPHGPLKCVKKGDVVEPTCRRRVHTEL